MASRTAADERDEVTARTVRTIGETLSRSASNKDKSSSFAILILVPSDLETVTDWTDCHYGCERLDL